MKKKKKKPTDAKTDVARKPGLLTAGQVGNWAAKPRQRGTIGELHRLGREIQARIERLDVLGGKTVNMKDSIDYLLADAEKLCDPGGFEEFKKLYSQGFSQSWTYKLLAVEEGRTTREEIRADTRQRVAKCRAAKRAVTESADVTSDKEDTGVDEAPNARALDTAEKPAGETVVSTGGQVDADKPGMVAQVQLAEPPVVADSPTDDQGQGLTFEDALDWLHESMDRFRGLDPSMPAKIFAWAQARAEGFPSYLEGCKTSSIEAGEDWNSDAEDNYTQYYIFDDPEAKAEFEKIGAADKAAPQEQIDKAPVTDLKMTYIESFASMVNWLAQSYPEIFVHGFAHMLNLLGGSYPKILDEMINWHWKNAPTRDHAEALNSLHEMITAITRQRIDEVDWSQYAHAQKEG